MVVRVTIERHGQEPWGYAVEVPDPDTTPFPQLVLEEAERMLQNQALPRIRQRLMVEHG